LGGESAIPQNSKRGLIFYEKTSSPILRKNNLLRRKDKGYWAIQAKEKNRPPGGLRISRTPVPWVVAFFKEKTDFRLVPSFSCFGREGPSYVKATQLFFTRREKDLGKPNEGDRIAPPEQKPYSSNKKKGLESITFVS